MINNGPQSIMIVDDMPANLHVLGALLMKSGYRVRTFERGRLALAAAAQEPPDLILLDIAMPEMDGYEVCSRLKANPMLAAIPVIFLSALSETVDKVMAFGCGGSDYITKPFEFEEVHARVEAHLGLNRQRNELLETCARLRESERVRDNLTHLVVHDMRTPICIVRMSLELLQASATSLGDHDRKIFARAWQATSSLMELVNQVLDINRMESGQFPLEKTECNLAEALQATFNAMAPLLSEHQVRMTANEPLIASCDEGVLRRILQNLMGNALKFTPAGGEITVSAVRKGMDAQIAICDSGPGIPAEYQDRIFDKFVQVEGEHRGEGTGLGLTFCKLAVEAHGGHIGVNGNAGKGSTFWFTLPLTGQPTDSEKSAG